MNNRFFFIDEASAGMSIKVLVTVFSSHKGEFLPEMEPEEIENGSRKLSEIWDLLFAISL